MNKNMLPRLGWIGLGIMGHSMASRLMDAGYPLTVFNRTRTKAEPLLSKGAVWGDTPKSVAQSSEIVFSMVGFPEDVREVALGDNGVLNGLKSGGVYVDMTTSSPSLAVEIAEAALQRNIVTLDAPVSGGDVGARNGTLSIMIGGDETTADVLTPIWNQLGKTIVHHGPPGSGQHAKMVNQTLIAGNMIGLCEAFLYARKSGLDMEKVLQSVSSGAAGSWSLSNLGPRMQRGDFAPGFMIEHFVKDLGMALAESRRMGLSLPGLELADRLYRCAIDRGFAKSGTQALLLALDDIS